jgi:hypothetical protein
MTHLIATTAAHAIERPPESPLAMDRYGCKQPRTNMAAHRLSIRLESIFRSCAANCLEMPRSGFHYSVIGRHAPALLASGRFRCHPLNDEVSTSHSEVVAPGVIAQGGDKCRSNLIGPVMILNRWKKD